LPDSDGSREEAESPGVPATAPGAVRTEDGTPAGSEPRDRQRRLQSLFVDVTGTDELIERRSDSGSSRRIDDGDESDLSEYVTAVARNDGLSDAISVPDVEGGFD
jgi:hypothetical protein